MRTSLIAISALFLVSEAHAATIEEWECRDKFGSSEAVLAEAKVNEGRETGAISVAGVTHKTRYQVAGFDRRWDFGIQKDGTYTYAFIISPDGTGTYFDFGGAKTAKPSILMQCTQRTIPQI